MAQNFKNFLNPQTIINRIKNRQNPFLIKRSKTLIMEKTPILIKKKESSLKSICWKILKNYYNKKDVEIHLNQFANKLQVERRRIYDIINILEGFDIVVKKEKNIYIWKGLDVFKFKFSILDIICEKANKKNIKVFNFESIQKHSKKKSLTYLSIEFLKKYYKKDSQFSIKQLLKDFSQQNKQKNTENQKNLQNQNLQTKINSENQKNSKIGSKNKIRRIYDIINVFKALGLINQTVSQNGKKMFVWNGIDGLNSKLKVLIKKDFFDIREKFVDNLNYEKNCFVICPQVQKFDIFDFKKSLIFSKTVF